MKTSSLESLPGFVTLLAAGAAFSSSWAMDVVLAPGLPLVAVFGYAAVFAYLLRCLVSRFVAPTSYTYLWIVLFMLWASVSVLWSRDLSSSVSNIYYFFLSFCLFIATANACVSLSAWRLIGAAYCLGLLLSSAVLIYNMYSGNVSIDQRSAVGDINPNYLSYALATGIPVLLAVSGDIRSNALRLLVSGIGISSILVGILMTGSRSGLTAAILCLAVHSMIVARRAFFFTMFASALILLVVTFAYDYLPDTLQARLDIAALALSSGANVNDNLSGRFDVWPLAWDYFREHPLWGIGIGSFDAINPYGIRAHNFILSLAADVGLIGLTLYILIIGSILRLAMLSANLRRYRGLTIMVATVWAAVSVSGVWESSPAAWIVFAWLFAGARQAPLGAAVVGEGESQLDVRRRPRARLLRT